VADVCCDRTLSLLGQKRALLDRLPTMSLNRVRSKAAAVLQQAQSLHRRQPASLATAAYCGWASQVLAIALDQLPKSDGQLRGLIQAFLHAYPPENSETMWLDGLSCYLLNQPDA